MIISMKLKENITGQKAIYDTVISFEIKDMVIYLDFVARHSSLFSFSDKYNDALYNGDACEIFVDYGNKTHYIDIEVAPNNTLFIALVKKTDKSLTFLDSNFVESKTEKYLDGYKASLKIDLKALDKDVESIKYNIFRIETDGGTANAHLFALNPTLCGTFHVQEKFLETIVK